MTRKRKLLWVFSGFFILIITGLVFLSQTDFSGETARIIQKEIAETLGYELELNNPRGNPLTGFSARDIVLRDGEKVLATAENIGFRLSPSTLRERHPVLSKIIVTGLDASSEHLTLVAEALKGRREEPSLQIRKVLARDSHLRTGAGLLLVREGLAELHEGSTEVKLDLEFLQRRITLRGKLAKLPSGLEIHGAGGNIDGTPFELSGRLGASPDVRGSFDRLPVELLPLIFPSLDPDEFQGSVSLDVRITRGLSSLDFEGNLHMPKATVGGFHFTDTRSRWSFHAGQLLFEEIEGTINNSPFMGNLGMLFRKGENILWTIEARGNDLKVEAWKPCFSWLDSFSGNIPRLTVNLNGPSDRFEGLVTLGSANVELMDKAFGGLTGDIALSLPETVSLNLEGFWSSSPITIAGKVRLSANPELSIDITSRAFCLKDVRGLNGWLEKMIPEGDMAGTLQIRGPQNAPRFAWNLSSDRIRIRGELLEDLAMEGETGADKLVISKTRGTWRGGKIRAKGQLIGLSRTGHSLLNLEGDLRSLPLEALEGTPPLKGKASGTWSLSGNSEETLLKADLSVEKPRWGDLGADRLKFTGKLKGDEVLLEHIEAEGFMNGSLKGKGTLTFDENLNTVFNLSGDLEGLDMRVLAPPLAARTPGFSGTLKGSFRLTGDSHAPNMEIEAKTEGLNLFSLPLGETAGNIRWSRSKVDLRDWKLPLWGGGITLSGQIGSGDGDGATLNLKGTFSDIDLLLASQAFEVPVKFSGKASGTFGLSGPSEDPLLDLRAEAPQFFLDGFGTTGASLIAKGPFSGIEIDTFQATVGESEISGGGFLSLASPWEFRFDIGGDDLDLTFLIRNLARGKGLDSEGKGNIRAEGTLNAEGLTGEGRLVAPSLKLWGLWFEDLDIPFVLMEGYLTVEDGKGSLHGGPLETQWTLGLREEQWGGKISLREADLDSAVREAFNPKGQVSGTADFRLHLSGTYGKAFLLNGTGELNVKDGQVKGFSSQEKLAESLDFRALSASFTIDGKTIYLLPGSRVSAPPGNSLYRYISLDGSIVPGGPMDLSGYGDVNLQALNAFLGGLQGLFAAGENSEERIRQVLSGLLGGVTNAKNFREVEFALEGNWDAPRLTKLRTVASTASEALSPIPDSPSDPDQRPDPGRISLKIEIPAGEGGSAETNGMGEQIKQQVLEQILRQILGPEDDDGKTDEDFSN